jgi:hypothetical protein
MIWWFPLCNRQTCLVAFSALKLQFEGRHVAQLGHIILQVFTLTHKWCVLSGEAAYANFIVWFYPPELEPTIYYNRNENAKIHYTTDKVTFVNNNYQRYVDVSDLNVKAFLTYSQRNWIRNTLFHLTPVSWIIFVCRILKE